MKALRDEIKSRKKTHNAENKSEVVSKQDVIEADKTAVISNIRRQKNHFFKLLLRLPLYWRKKLAIGLFASLSILVVIFLSGLVPENRMEDARWLDFRAFLARSFELSHAELDQVYSESFGKLPDPGQKINQQQAAQIEQTLQKLFQQPGLRIFPNPFFSASNGQETDSNLSTCRFSDVPAGHPVYFVLQPLLELNLNLADKQNHIRPYEPMSWNDWQNTVDQLFQLLAIEPDLSRDIASQRHGYMSNIDIRNCIEHLREKLYIKSQKPLIWSQETIYPSRLEGFATLAAVMKELNAR
ncbi:MAG: hypothetical protein ACD_39C00864G0004 [uncultured bacterium]|nr:MAG: hypothetical protein ACD_39C00864G0004 [uncultured bacterium]